MKKLKRRNNQTISTQERNLMAGVQNGELDSFSPLYSQFSKVIFRYILKHVKLASVAEELTQDIFLKVYQFRWSYNSEYEVSSWIWTIARNTLYDYLRQSRGDPRPFQFVQFHQDSDFEPASLETAETIMIQELEKRKLLDLMATLSKKQKEAIFLRLVKKFSYKEISKSMNLSLSAVKSLINRGKTSLIKLSSAI